MLSKDFKGGVLVMTGANSAVGLRSMPARYLFMDEIDGYPADIEGEGDPILLAERRTATFNTKKKIFLVSTPTIKGVSAIEREFSHSDQRFYKLPCPFCGGKVSLVPCDDEGNLHDEAYREHPYSGLGFMLHHAHEENPECPIASYECDGGILGGVYIYDTEEQATEAWNRRADNG